MIKYVNKTVRIHANEKLGISIDEALDKELQDIYTKNKKEDILSMTITPIIGTVQGLRIPIEYWIVYVHSYSFEEKNYGR